MASTSICAKRAELNTEPSLQPLQVCFKAHTSLPTYLVFLLSSWLCIINGQVWKKSFLEYKREEKILKGETRVLFLWRRGRLESRFLPPVADRKAKHRIGVTFLCLFRGKSPDFVHFRWHFYSFFALVEMGRGSALLSCLYLIGHIDTDLNEYMVYLVLNFWV